MTPQKKKNRLKLERYQADLERAQRIGQLGYWQANLITGELFWSDMIYEIFGVHKREFEPSIEAFNSVVHPDDLALVHASEEQAKITGVHDVVHRIVRPNGEIRWVHELADFNDNDKNTMLVGTVRDITQQKIYELDLERLSLTDELTGAYNRRYCYNRLDQLLGSAVKRGFQWLWPCLISIFSKKVNDTYGHDIGDSVLKQFATTK